MIKSLGEKHPDTQKAAFIASDAAILGDVTLAEGTSVWYGAVIRGDLDHITIGKNSNVQDNCSLHGDRGYPITLGEGVSIGHNAVVHGASVGDNTVIGMGSGLLNGCVIGKNSIVKNTYITESTLEENVSIGPFSQVRPGCHIAAGCKIGDFVEVKNSHIGQKTAIAHLTYVGDTDCGSGVNFGCGVAIANFNGKEKFRTTIGDGAFLGCNTNLVAPVTIGAGAYTAAGATVTREVPEDAMLIARAEQTVKPGLARRFRREKK